MNQTETNRIGKHRKGGRVMRWISDSQITSQGKIRSRKDRHLPSNGWDTKLRDSSKTPYSEEDCGPAVLHGKQATGLYEILQKQMMLPPEESSSPFSPSNPKIWLLVSMPG